MCVGFGADSTLWKLAASPKSTRLARRVSEKGAGYYVWRSLPISMTELRAQLQASLGAAFAIERELGGGGMSRVFVAEDTSLGRQVVVKVLPGELSGSVSVERFRREISLAARLQHPHIVPLLSAGEVDGLPYYTMPFVDGESLRAKIGRGELSIADTISILRDVARALEFAHSRGVTHRDIKPDNVLLAGSSAVITDFGVAKAVSDATNQGTLTSIGVALGTPAYMAPEQAAADPSTDARADIYAFGAMAYEMLAGHSPFAGRSMQGMLAAHATEVPPPIAALRPTTPRRLAELVMCCLEKRPGDRPQSASEIVQALDAATTSDTNAVSASGRTLNASTALSPLARRLLVAGVAVVGVALGVWWWPRSPAVSADDIRSIAVMPFENKSGDTTFDYLEDGITDHVRDALNAIAGLTVKARGSSQQLKGRQARESGAKLGVGAVLQGSVSGPSSRLHVTAELVRVSDDVALWSGTFDGQASQLAGMQDTIVRAIVGRLNLGRDGAHADVNGVSARGTNNIDAYHLYLRGRHAADADHWDMASDLFRQAIALDPRFARAYGALAISYSNETTLGVASVDSMNTLARAAETKALALDANTPEAYVAEGNALLNEMRFVESEAAFEKAYRADSLNADIIWPYAVAQLFLGRVDKGVALLRRGRDLDPLSPRMNGLLGYGLELLRRYDEAIVSIRVAVELHPKGVLGLQGLGFVFAFNNMPDSAVHAFEAAFALDSTLFGRRTNLIFGYAAAGRWADASRQRALLEREPPTNSPNYYRFVAQVAFGEYDAAMNSLERGVTAREPLFGILSIPCDPLFDPLQPNPRFAALVKRLGGRPCAVTTKWPIALPPKR
jgi:serine/threonine protein kinase/tetratricopeptide (TPR) repeat protein